MKFKVLAGSHYENQTLFKTGETFESHYPLDEMFPMKIQLIDSGKSSLPSSMARLSPPDEQSTLKVDKSSTIKGQTARTTPTGVLVDGDFEFDSEELGLHVYLNESKYFIYDTDDMSEPCNKKGLSKNKVMSYIDKMCAD